MDLSIGTVFRNEFCVYVYVEGREVTVNLPLSMSHKHIEGADV